MSEDLGLMGLAADLREVEPRRSFGDIVWYILAALPLQPFLDKLAEDAASDAYERLKTLTARIVSRRPRSSDPEQRVLVLQDSQTGVQVVFEQDLPPESYEQLLHFDLSTIKLGPLHYDRHVNRWRSELDEADKTIVQSPPRID